MLFIIPLKNLIWFVVLLVSAKKASSATLHLIYILYLHLKYYWIYILSIHLEYTSSIQITLNIVCITGSREGEVFFDDVWKCELTGLSWNMFLIYVVLTVVNVAPPRKHNSLRNLQLSIAKQPFHCSILEYFLTLLFCAEPD